MEKEASSGVTGFIDAIGGADMFVWIVMFTVLIIFVLVMAYINKDIPRD